LACESLFVSVLVLVRRRRCLKVEFRYQERERERERWLRDYYDRKEEKNLSIHSNHRLILCICNEIGLIVVVGTTPA
jgi:hypothetical protein